MAGQSLSAMMHGGPVFLPNPMNVQRGMQRQRKRRTLAQRMVGRG